jgi:hypothetical protein
VPGKMVEDLEAEEVRVLARELLLVCGKGETLTV